MMGDDAVSTGRTESESRKRRRRTLKRWGFRIAVLWLIGVVALYVTLSNAFGPLVGTAFRTYFHLHPAQGEFMVLMDGDFHQDIAWHRSQLNTHIGRYSFPQSSTDSTDLGFAYMSTRDTGQRVSRVIILQAWPLSVPAVLYLIVHALLSIDRSKPPGLCIKCGYDLRASPHACPECGTPIAKQPPESKSRRRSICQNRGRF